MDLLAEASVSYHSDEIPRVYILCVNNAYQPIMAGCEEGAVGHSIREFFFFSAYAFADSAHFMIMVTFTWGNTNIHYSCNCIYDIHCCRSGMQR